MENQTKYIYPSPQSLYGCMDKYLHHYEFETKRFQLKIQIISEEQLHFIKMRDAVRAQSCESTGLESNKPYICLTDMQKKEVVMSDTPMEVRTNFSFIKKANGHVLIAGFGIGFIVMAIQDNPLVKSITIIEKEADILEHVAKKLPLNSKVKLIHGDIFQWSIPKNTIWDVIYFDIWNNISADNYPEMKKLVRRFQNKLNRDNKDSLIDSWRRNDCRKLYYEDR